MQKFKNGKSVIRFLAVIIIFMAIVGIYRTFAVYKIQKKIDVLKSNVIKSIENDNLKLSVLVDGQEANTFPTSEDNYYVESIDCTNGVTATFDVDNWQVNITDMSSTSTKCTISFDSTRRNQKNPESLNKEQIISLNEKVSELTKSTMIDSIYPIGSIYMSTEDDTVEDVEQRLGGSWEKFAEGKTLISANAEYPIDTTGGTASETYTPAGTNSGTAITVAQMPAHSHTFTGTANKATGNSPNLNHRHYNNFNTGNNSANPTIGWGVSNSNSVMIITHGTNPGTNAGIHGGPAGYAGYINNPQPSGSHTHAITGWGSYVNNSTNAWNHSHSVTAAGSNSNTGSGQAHTHTFTGTAATISHMQPYQTTYMYKRVS